MLCQCITGELVACTVYGWADIKFLIVCSIRWLNNDDIVPKKEVGNINTIVCSTCCKQKFIVFLH